jgi:hypothetical protein
MTAPHDDDRTQARREAATLLGVDIEHLSAADGLRIDMIAALRLVIDSEQASILSGGQADLGKLNVAVQSLIALLPNRELPEPAPVDGGPNDPRVHMWNTYKQMRDRGADVGQGYDGALKRIATLEAEIAALKAGAPAPDLVAPETSGARAQPLLPDNVVPMPRPSSAPAAGPTVTNVTVAAPPSAPAYDYNANQDWKSYVNPDGSIRSTPRGRWDT